MKRSVLGALAAILVAVPVSSAFAHVTVQPNEAIIGAFSRFVVRVPNERPDADTTKVVVKLPPLTFVSFEPKDGWTRKVKMVELEEPLDAFGQEITEAVGKVTWSGGRIGPGEFLEFGFSARMPEGEETLEFRAVQTYSGGEVVRWTGAPDSETPAATVKTYDLNLEEGQGELAALAEVRAASGEEPADDDESEAAGEDEDEDEDEGVETETLLSGIAVVLALIALVLALRRGSGSGAVS